MSFQSRSTSPLQTIGCLISGVLLAAVIFTLTKLALKFYWYIGLAFLLGALIINWRIVLQSCTWAMHMIKRDPIRGIISLLFSAIAFPFVAFGLFTAAIAQKRMKNMFSQFEEQVNRMSKDHENLFSKSSTQRRSDDDGYTDFEEIERKPK